jgi:hypothetical protein
MLANIDFTFDIEQTRPPHQYLLDYLSARLRQRSKDLKWVL